MQSLQVGDKVSVKVTGPIKEGVITMTGVFDGRKRYFVTNENNLSAWYSNKELRKA